MTRKAALVFIFLLLLGLPVVHAAPQLNPDPGQLEKLSQENAWWRLIHYKQQYGRIRSQVDDARFFLSDEGDRNPLAELRATLDQLNHALQDAGLSEQEDLRCRFPARFEWLNRTLDARLPGRDCPDLQVWLDDIDAGSLSLIFPSAYLNNASSMFGHSLLRIDGRDRSQRPDLVAKAVNFAALVDGDDGSVTYALKGMLGLYPGYFSLLPYYEKVNEYSHLENRDIWEYPLQLSDAGLQRVLLHMWELDGIRFDYWFFDENCSYQLLALLSVAEDHLDLTAGFDIKALPVDTVRALSRAGLLQDEGHYRPAFATLLDSMSRQVTSEELHHARLLVFDQTAPDALPLPDSVSPARVYELAFQWLNFRYQHESLPRAQAAPQLHRLLVARSRVGQPAGFVPVQVPEVPPHQGHDSAQWSVAAGWHEEQGFLQLAAKPAYHGRFDAVEGYLPNAEINLLELSLRYYEDTEKIEPWHLNVVEVGNYLSSSPVFRLSAWRIEAEIGRVTPGARFRDDWRGRLGGGYGRAWGSSTDLMAYLFLALELEAGPQAGVQMTVDDSDWAAGGGLAAGFVWEPLDALRGGLDLRAIHFPVGAEGEAYQAEATLQWNYARNQSLRLQGQVAYREGSNREVHLAWLRFF